MIPDGPTISIHKGWQLPHRTTSRTSLRKENRSAPSAAAKSRPTKAAAVAPEVGSRPVKFAKRQYTFVNATKSELNIGADVRKLARIHVSNESSCHSKRKKVKLLGKSGKHSSAPVLPSSTRSSTFSTDSHQENSDAIPQLIGFPTALCSTEYPIDMQPRTHQLLNRYLTHSANTRYPIETRLETKPLFAGDWFRYAVTDPAMLHAMLYAGAIYLALLEGKRETEDTVYHLGQTIRIVNKRLSESERPPEDSTIGAISCLALGEAITGNLDLWHIHMRGLNEMIRSRGSISLLNGMLQTKLRRTDVTGAIDYGATPYLDFHRSEGSSISSILPQHKLKTIRKEITQLLTCCKVHPDLIATMVELSHFSQAVQLLRTKPEISIDAAAFSEDMYWIEYKLLSFPTAIDSEEQDVDKACRFGALLYMKAILEEFPHSTTGHSILLGQLQVSLLEISDIRSCAPLLHWLSLVGAGLAKTEQTRKWFVTYLARLMNTVRISSAEMAMSRMLCIEQDFERPVEKIREEVKAIRRHRKLMGGSVLAIL